MPKSNPWLGRLAFFGAGVLCTVGYRYVDARKNTPPSGTAVPLRQLPGGPDKVDVAKVLRLAEENSQLPKGKLAELELLHVRSDGTMDLATEKGGFHGIKASFSSFEQGGPWNTNYTYVRVQYDGLHYGQPLARAACLPRTDDEIKCSPKQIWESMIELGAPRDAEANIHLEKGRWTFFVEGGVRPVEVSDTTCRPSREALEKLRENPAWPGEVKIAR